MVLFPRWLTTAARILRLFISKHELSNQSRKILRLLAQYICSAYGTVWYRIKQDPHWNNGPLHLLSHIKAIKQQPKEIQDIAFKVVEIGFYYGHSERLQLEFENFIEEYFTLRKKFNKMMNKQEDTEGNGDDDDDP